MEEQPDVEILVHIRAPSRAADDARYRSLAAAYLAFEPTAPTYISPQNEDGGSGWSAALQRWEADEAEDDGSFAAPLDEKLGSFRSPQASFRSVVDNANSPHIRAPRGGMSKYASHQQSSLATTQSSCPTPPSFVQDSHPMNQTEFDSLTSPTRVLENFLQNFDSPLPTSHDESQASIPAAPRKPPFRKHGRPSRTGDLVPCTPQTIPCTPRARASPELPSGGEGKPVQVNGSQHGRDSNTGSAELSDDPIIEETTVLSSPQPTHQPEADVEPPPKRRRLYQDAASSCLARATSDIGPRSFSANKEPVTITFLSTHGYTYESLEIQPPEPPVAALHIESEGLITPGLQKLGRDVDISLRFRPGEQTRDLRPFERGYWLLDCSSWEPRLKHAAWAFLANYIGAGVAGWGVWCRRDSDFTELRVYCWGSVVAHIYYVLWMASQRRIKFTGSTWIDGEGVAAIVMGPRHHTQN
ncbi:hypothetical protein GGS20DRAFT_154176 [Poronia punctata]|nr:hypothetical protein GGS20DRAFT_154176 [Poronia punctata]